MQNYAYARGGAAPRGPQREGPAEEGFVRHPRFLFRICINLMASCHHCRPSELAHILLFTQMSRLAMVKSPKLQIELGQYLA